jgi:hypothetical protein
MSKFFMMMVAALGLSLSVANAAEGGHISAPKAQYSDAAGGKLPTELMPRYAGLVSSAHVVLA